jgi:hypothetical protein
VLRRVGGFGGRPRASRWAFVSRSARLRALTGDGATRANNATTEKSARMNLFISKSWVVSRRGRTVGIGEFFFFFARKDRNDTTRRASKSKRPRMCWGKEEDYLVPSAVEVLFSSIMVAWELRFSTRDAKTSS